MKKIYRDRAKLKPKIETARIRESRALPIRSEEVSQALLEMDAVFMRLYSDDNFITLLQAESLTEIPGRCERILKGLATCL
jgi:hypothetical protein